MEYLFLIFFFNSFFRFAKSFFAHTVDLDYEYHIRRAVSASVRTVHVRFLRMYRLLFSYIEEIKPQTNGCLHSQLC